MGQPKVFQSIVLEIALHGVDFCQRIRYRSSRAPNEPAAVFQDTTHLHEHIKGSFRIGVGQAGDAVHLGVEIQIFIVMELIHNQHVDRSGTDQRLGDFQCLLAAIRLRDQQVVDIHAQFARVGGVQGVLGIDKCGQAACLLRLGDDLQADRRLARGLGAEDLADTAAGDAAHAQSRVEADGTSGDNGDGHQRLFGAEPNNRPFAKLFFDLCKGNFYGFGAVVGYGHGKVSSMCSPGASAGFSRGNAGGLNWISMGL